MSDWIDNLKQETEAKAHLAHLEKEHEEQAHLLILEKAPELWKGFTSLIEQEVKKLDDTFRGQDAMTLTFQWDLADKIVVTNASAQTGFTAQWNPGDVIIKLGFTEQLLGMEGVTGGHDQITLAVSPHGEIVMVYGEATGPDKIAEVLLKRLLTPEKQEQN